MAKENSILLESFDSTLIFEVILTFFRMNFSIRYNITHE